MTVKQLDIDFVRQQFPAFSEPSLQGWGFFENAGGSYACRQVIDRLSEYYTKTKVQPYYSFPASQLAGEKMDESYLRLAAYLNIDQEELNFGPSTSQNVYVLANALRPMWKEGDEIIVSCQDHEANAGAWRRLVDTGLVVKEWLIDPQTGILDQSSLDKLISEKTRMIAFPHASNIVAHINPVKEIAARAHEVGAIAVVDGVSYAPHGLPDIKSLDADIYLFSLYKTWGPHLGAMFVRNSLRKQMSNQSHYFNDAKPHYMLTPAGPDHAQIAAAAGVAEYLDALYEHHYESQVDDAEKGRQLHQLFANYESKLLEPLMAFLNQREDIFVIGPSDSKSRASTISILPLKKPVKEVASTLLKNKLMVGVGDFYGVRPLTAMGIDLDPGVIRVSFIHYTSEAEIAQLISGLESSLR